jgi:hypothetical protein
MRIFLGLGDICGYYSQLEEGFRALGVSCVLVNAYPSRAYARSRRPGPLGRLIEWLGERRVAAGRGSAGRMLWTAAEGFALVFLFLATLPRHDVYIFSGGTTFLGLWDLPVLKLLRKRVVVVFHGTDSRPPFISGALAGVDGDVDVPALVRETAAMKRRLRRIERYADLIVNHCMSSQLHERSIVNWLSVGIPTRCEPLNAAPADDAADRPCVIAHAPTRPGPKGSARIESAVRSLQARGHRIEFVNLVDRPQADVLAAIARCDFVVDELYSDTTMASFATEAATFGRPAVVGTYGYDVLRKHTNEAVIPPAFVCHPDEVEPAIERLIVDRDTRRRLGATARRFVEEHWRADRVAARFLRLLEGRAPREWWFDPREVLYLHGWGLTDRRAREVVGAIIERAGVAALQLDDKPELEQAFVEFARQAAPEADEACRAAPTAQGR